MTDIQTWLDKGRALADQATQGPWEARMDTPTMGGEVWTLRTVGKPGIKMVVREYQFGEGNAQFIADARTRLPQALAAIQAVLEIHHDRGDGVCYECSVGTLVDYPCSSVRAIHDAIKETEA